MTILWLKAKTSKGKNIIDLYGDNWIVLKEMDGAIRGDYGHWFLVAPVDTETTIRWIKQYNDKDFSMEFLREE